MAIYLCVFFLFLYLACRYDIGGKKKQPIQLEYLCVFILMLVEGLRNHVGGDTFNYEIQFEKYPILSELSSQDFLAGSITQPLWFLINVTLKSIWNNFIIIQIFHAVVLNLLLYRFVKRSTNYFFTAFLFILCICWWNFALENYRESLCVALYLNGLLYLKHNNVKKFFLICLPALFIHYFAFVIILLTLVFYFIDKKVIVAVTVILGLTLFLFVDTDSLLGIMMQMSLLVSSDTEEIFYSYLYGDKYGTTNLNIFGIIMQFIFVISTIIVLICKKHDDLSFKLLFLYIVLFIIQSKMPIISRFNNYLLVIMIIETIEFLYTKQYRKNPLYYVAAVFFLFTTNYYVHDFYRPKPWFPSQYNYDIRYFPYTSVFEKPDPVREANCTPLLELMY